jgi:hypothetical protein
VRRPQVRFLGTLAVLLAIGFPVSATTFSDVLHLSDGTVISGSIVEEEPGRSYTVETIDGERIVCRVDRVERIEKRLEPVESSVQQRSIVFLTDGVVFKGVVVERVPGGSMVLELANGRLVHLTAEEIAKIATEAVSGGVAKERPLAPASTRKAIVEFEIVLVQHQIAEAEKKLKEAAPASDARAGLEAEVTRLRQELEALSEERKRASEEAAQEEKEVREFEQEFGEIATGIREAREEVAKRVGSCSVPELRNRMQETLAEIDQKAAEIVQRTEVVARTVEPDPRLVPIRQTQSRSELVGMVANRLWNDPAYREQFTITAAGLPVKARQQVYQENRRSGWFGRMLWNVIPFLSVGSWGQGDALGAAIGMASSIGGAVMVAVSMAPSDFDLSVLPWDTPLGLTGLVLASAGYLYSLVEPAIFVSDQNAMLAKALGLRPGGGAP